MMVSTTSTPSQNFNTTTQTPTPPRQTPRVIKRHVDSFPATTPLRHQHPFTTPKPALILVRKVRCQNVHGIIELIRLPRREPVVRSLLLAHVAPAGRAVVAPRLVQRGGAHGSAAASGGLGMTVRRPGRGLLSSVAHGLGRRVARPPGVDGRPAAAVAVVVVGISWLDGARREAGAGDDALLGTVEADAKGLVGISYGLGRERGKELTHPSSYS